jgi:biotin carboxylase
LGEFVGPDGKVLQRTETTVQQKQVFKALGVPEPPVFFAVIPNKKAGP